MTCKLLFTLAISALLLAGCKKENDSAPEARLQGIWVKGPNFGDTLMFYTKSGFYVMKSNQSFNPGLYAPRERSYYFHGDTLVLNTGVGITTMDFPVTTFQWKTRGKVFEVAAHQIYPFMASTAVKFEFRKVL